MVNVQTVQMAKAIEAAKRDIKSDFERAVTDLEARFKTYMDRLEQQVKDLTFELASKN
jgi:hypothetical protein